MEEGARKIVHNNKISTPIHYSGRRLWSRSNNVHVTIWIHIQKLFNSSTKKLNIYQHATIV